jgi:DnaJ-class molecular chaperone
MELEEADCEYCAGTGICRTCDGTREGARHFSGAEYIYSDPCPDCDGSGECQICQGTGRLKRIVKNQPAL